MDATDRFFTGDVFAKHLSLGKRAEEETKTNRTAEDPNVPQLQPSQNR
jgi:hypothetical protein